MSVGPWGRQRPSAGGRRRRRCRLHRRMSWALSLPRAMPFGADWVTETPGSWRSWVLSVSQVPRRVTSLVMNEISQIASPSSLNPSPV